jgi:hypothetical protein
MANSKANPLYSKIFSKMKVVGGQARACPPTRVSHDFSTDTDSTVDDIFRNYEPKDSPLYVKIVD